MPDSRGSGLGGGGYGSGVPKYVGGSGLSYGPGGGASGSLPSYKYGSGSGIGGGIGSLGQAGLNSFANIPKYSNSGIAGGVGTLGGSGASDTKF